MEYKGLKDLSTFGEFHPLVTTTYYVLAIGLTMFSNRPDVLIISTLVAAIYQFVIKGAKSMKTTGIMAVSVLVFTTLINGLFTHNGETVLFYIDTNRVTLEAILYGATMSLMIIGVITWFASFNEIMTSDKLIYIFGKMAPVLGLVISMIFRFIPLLKRRYEDISVGQDCMGRKDVSGFVNKSKLATKKVSILIAWSLESSIESADSMSARGYGLKGRTSFHLFKWEKKDVLAMIYFGITGAIAITLFAFGYGKMLFYPKIDLSFGGWQSVALCIDLVLLFAAPIVIDLFGEYRWRKLDLTM